jgi:hypothetical protein
VVGTVALFVLVSLYMSMNPSYAGPTP